MRLLPSIVSLVNTTLNIAVSTLVRILHVTDAQLQWISEVDGCVSLLAAPGAGITGTRRGAHHAASNVVHRRRGSGPSGHDNLAQP